MRYILLISLMIPSTYAFNTKDEGRRFIRQSVQKQIKKLIGRKNYDRIKKTTEQDLKMGNGMSFKFRPIEGSFMFHTGNFRCGYVKDSYHIGYTIAL